MADHIDSESFAKQLLVYTVIGAIAFCGAAYIFVIR